VIRISFTPPADDPEWDRWVAEVEILAEQMLDNEDARGQIRDELYKFPRQLLLKATHGKCAYCEEKIEPGQRHGDVEHYRPKAAVRDINGQSVMIERGGEQVKHPGYYWLAYNYSNLLPSCLACNRRALNVGTGLKTGKADLFPTLDGQWASRPDEVNTERPALLNPWLANDDPAEHLALDIDTGRVIGRTERGRITVELIGLNRDGLPEARKLACEAVTDAYSFSVSDQARGITPRLQPVLDAKYGIAEYSAFQWAAITRARQRVLEQDKEFAANQD